VERVHATTIPMHEPEDMATDRHRRVRECRVETM
jgi:hypothetical protein